jgi:PEGA domain
MTKIIVASTATGDLYITSTPSRSCVYIDDNVILDETGSTVKTPIQIVGILEGMHKIDISLNGYEREDISVDILPNQVNNVNIVMTPK